MIFADPPYYEANQQSHYVHYFSNNDHLRLAELLRNTNHYFYLYTMIVKILGIYTFGQISKALISIIDSIIQIIMNVHVK